MRSLALAMALVLAGCASAPDLPSDRPVASPAGGAAGGVATDQPCTRSVATEPEVREVPFQLQDLERMIPPVADIPGLVGFEDDLVAHGYHDNAELNSIVPSPATTCDDLERFGRVTGYGIGYARPDDQAHHLLFAVHLFGGEAAAAAWPDAFFGGFAATAGKPNGPDEFTMTRPPNVPANTIVAEHVGSDGVRNWASVTRGRIVGWVIDLHPEGAPTLDVATAVSIMSNRIDAVAAEAASADRVGADAAHFLSAALPLSIYGPRGNGLAWDWFFGGCADAVERGMIAGDQARIDAERFGRVSGCTAMYSPPGGGATPDGTVRVFSSVSMHAEPEGASESVTTGLAELSARGGVPFDVPQLGDEAFGQVTPVDAGDTTYTDTRVVLRRGAHVGVVALHSTAPVDASAELIELGTALDDRMSEFLEP